MGRFPTGGTSHDSFPTGGFYPPPLPPTILGRVDITRKVPRMGNMPYASPLVIGIWELPRRSENFGGPDVTWLPLVIGIWPPRGEKAWISADILFE